MEIEKIVSTVQEKIGKTDVSAQTIRAAVEFRNSVAPLADGVEPDDAYFDGIVTLAKGFQGNINNIMATKANELRKNFKLNAEDIKNMDAAQLQELKALIDGVKQTPEESVKVKELETRIADLVKRLDKDDETRERDAQRQRVIQALSKERAADDYVFDNAINKLAIDGKKSDDELIEEAKKLFDAEYIKAHKGAAAPRFDGGSGASGEHQTFLQQKFAAKKAKEGWGKKA